MNVSGRLAPANPVLEISGLSLEFGGIKALSDVSFVIPEGIICGLIGPNGAGKSSLFNCVTRLYEPVRGQISFGGTSLLGVSPRGIVRLGIARTFQDLSLFEGLSVRENVLMGGHHRLRYGFAAAILKSGRYAAEEQQLHAEAQEILQTLSLLDVAESAVGDLPFGTLKRVELARALIAKPRLLLLDEPAGGLTQAEVGDLGDLIRSLRDAFDLAILLVEHHMGLVMRISEHVVVLNFGVKISEGDPEHVQSDPAVIKAYLGE
ncbi:Branched-chain amino acid transport system ATP-binding protein OS=Castellaniella defragrans OX=75697 GN=HNR28_000340 PE=4 SV=1 [Castellaniella defragrans]